MEILTPFFERDPEEWRPWLLLFSGFFFLAAFVTVLWWLLSKASDPESDEPKEWEFGGNDDSGADDSAVTGDWEFTTVEEKPGSPEPAFHIPGDTEIGARAAELAKWREEHGIAGSAEDDWILAERELYIEAYGVNPLPDRAEVYRNGTGNNGFEGIDTATAQELSRLGFSGTSSLAGLADADKSRLENWFSARNIEADFDSLTTGQSDASDFGFLYTEKPDETDDLTDITGINSSVQKRLNEKGVYRCEQIARWNDSNVSQFEEYLGVPGLIGRDEWVPQAQSLAQMKLDRATAVEEPEPELPQENRYEGLASQYEGEDVAVDQKLGVLFNQSAECRDDLTEIRGIGNVLSGTLNDRGVYRFQQIADWNDYNVWSFNRIIAFPGRIQRDEWIRQAKELAPSSRCLNPGSARVSEEELNDIVSLEFAGEDVEVREPFGIVYRTAPVEPDDLQDIKGVGPVLEKKLHDFGVYKFKQIANWPDAAIDEFQEQLSFPDRIRRDDWVGQCEKFIADA